jgi:hypothetical protein
VHLHTPSTASWGDHASWQPTRTTRLDLSRGAAYGNILTWFARQGMLGINATYRLAPAAKWPSAVDDVRGMVKWAKENAAKFGGDPSQIYRSGIPRAPPTSPRISSIAACSRRRAGRQRRGADQRALPARIRPQRSERQEHAGLFRRGQQRLCDRSPVTHIRDGVRVPVFVVVTEYDNPVLDIVGAELLAALCARDGACPRFTRLEKHNQLSEVAAFNTADEQLGREILEFMRRGR